MPPSVSYLFYWWLGPGRDALVQLIDQEHLGISPGEVGFAEAVRNSLDDFDNDTDLHDLLRSNWLQDCQSEAIVHLGSNPRRTLKAAANGIFNQSGSNGIPLSRALDGLGLLDDVETHRLRLLSAIQHSGEASMISPEELQIIQGLHGAATKRYRRSQLGFRGCVRGSFRIVVMDTQLLTYRLDPRG